MTHMSRFEALIEVRQAFASQEEMAAYFNVAQATVSRWLTQSKQLPAEHVLRAERATGVSRHALRPDIYPVDHDQPPADPGPECAPIMSRCNKPHQSNRQPILEERPAA